MTEENLGPAEAVTCLWQVDGEDCGELAVVRIIMRDKTGRVSVPVCHVHRAEHNRKAAQLRVKR